MSFAFDSKYRNRALLETWLHSVGGRAEYRRDDKGWTVTAAASADPETIIVTAGPVPTIEEACVVVCSGLGKQGRESRGSLRGASAELGNNGATPTDGSRLITTR